MIHQEISIKICSLLIVYLGEDHVCVFTFITFYRFYYFRCQFYPFVSTCCSIQSLPRGWYDIRYQNTTLATNMLYTGHTDAISIYDIYLLTNMRKLERFLQKKGRYLYSVMLYSYKGGVKHYNTPVTTIAHLANFGVNNKLSVTSKFKN